LNASRADFVHADARAATLAEGTLFFLYTPFRGRMLQQGLECSRVEAKRRAIRVCTWVPCTADVAHLDWLACRAGDTAARDEIVVFEAARG
jgi:hypothetical protein